jgi:hypothetical protein
VRSKFLALSAALVALAALSAPAMAECNSPGFNPGGNFCDGCTYQGYLSTSRDQPCTRPYFTGASVIQLVDHRLVEKARHGVAGLNGNTFAYAPAKSYVGADEFVIEVLYREHDKYGKFHVHWNVSVN